MLARTTCWTPTGPTLAPRMEALIPPLMGVKPLFAEKKAASYLPSCHVISPQQSSTLAAHWNIFHVGVTPAISCLGRVCGARMAASPDSI